MANRRARIAPRLVNDNDFIRVISRLFHVNWSWHLKRVGFRNTGEEHSSVYIQKVEYVREASSPGYGREKLANILFVAMVAGTPS